MFAKFASLGSLGPRCRDLSSLNLLPVTVKYELDTMALYTMRNCKVDVAIFERTKEVLSTYLIEIVTN